MGKLTQNQTWLIIIVTNCAAAAAALVFLPVVGDQLPRIVDAVDYQRSRSCRNVFCVRRASCCNVAAATTFDSLVLAGRTIYRRANVV